MDENKAVNEAESTLTNKIEKTPKSKVEKKSGGSFLKGVRTEFKKIIWPTRKDAAGKTVTVIVTSLIFGVIIFCMDTVYAYAYNFVMNLIP